MANTYELISSNVLSTAAASVTFSSIPATFTDLVVRWSARSDAADVNDYFALTINGATTGYSLTNLTGDGSVPGSTTLSSTSLRAYGCAGGNATANTFGSGELYIPYYSGSRAKIMSNFGANETDGAAFLGLVANNHSSTAVTSSITLTILTGPNIVSGSSFYLYGIKNT